MSDVLVALELVARVCRCCEDVRWNKRSARRVKAYAEAFEKVLEGMRKSGSWERHVEALWTLRGALGETEAVFARINCRSKMSAMRYAREDHHQLKDVEKKLATASDLLQVNFHVTAEQQTSDFNDDLLELVRLCDVDNQKMHFDTQTQIRKLDELLRKCVDVEAVTEQLSQVSMAINEDDTVTAADVGVFSKEALVIGVKSYVHSPLQNTLNDAGDLAEKLKGMGFRVALSLDPTLDDFDKVQDTFESRLRPGVLAFVYFAGHGCEYEGDNYLLMRETPDGVDERRLERTSIRMSKLMDGIRNREATFTVLILDACRSFHVKRQSRDVNTTGLVEVKPDGFKLQNAHHKSNGILIAYATKPGAVVREQCMGNEGRNGFYMHHLLRFLAAEKPVRDMLEDVCFTIIHESDGEQEPWIGSYMGSKHAKRIQLASTECNSSEADMNAPKIVVHQSKIDEEQQAPWTTKTLKQAQMRDTRRPQQISEGRESGETSILNEVERSIFGSKGLAGRYGIGPGKGGVKIDQLASDLNRFIGSNTRSDG